MMIDNNRVVEALRTVKDPNTGQDIIQRRMVEGLRIEGNNVNFTLVLPSLNMNNKTELIFACIAAIQKEYPDAQTNVHTLAKPQGGESHATQTPDRPFPHLKNIIAVASGKGGVGKSTVAVNLALGLKELGAKVGIMDADVYGPSIPTMLGLQGQRPLLREIYGVPKMVPLEAYGLQVISIGNIIEPEQAVVLRGPRLAGVIKQFFNDTLWSELDYLVVDLPPGTGDVQLTLVQTVPVTGVVIVTTPQEVAVIDAIKAINMFLLPQVNVPILGVVENMAWFTPEDMPERQYKIFGEGGGKKLAKQSESLLLGQIPLVMGIREGGDAGKPAVLGHEPITKQAFISVAQNTARQVALRNEMVAPTQKVNMQL
ncbi:MAG: Mrp/NBP35 family ATP-binding protein [Saprospiraceae bacterium]|nr:Mrp/NBP35 family ATP-binding protein [Saprospiraceae bacterium]